MEEELCRYAIVVKKTWHALVCIYDVLNLVVACVLPRFKCMVKLESNFGRVRWLYSTCGTKFSLSSCKCDLNLDELHAPTPKFSLGSSKCDLNLDERKGTSPKFRWLQAKCDLNLDELQLYSNRTPPKFDFGLSFLFWPL